MRRFILYTLTAILAALVLARALAPAPAQYVMATVGGAEYNMLDVELPVTKQTAGSALTAEMNAYYLRRTPTEKNALTGILRGKNLILILADSWAPDLSDRDSSPTLHRLWQEGAKFTQVYRPEWYQGMDGREFALLSGLMPTSVNDETSLVRAGEQGVCLPFAPARLFAAAGYGAYAFIPDPDHRAAYEAMGFGDVRVSADGGRLEAAEHIEACTRAGEPFFAFFLWDAPDCGDALARVTEALEDLSLLDSTAVCVLTGNDESWQAQLFLWSRGLPAPENDLPCSELDLAPTLENLFGLPFDSRFLSGRDVFAVTSGPGTADSLTPLVTLYGSAYSDWITDAGSYIASDDLFSPAADGPEGTAAKEYVQSVCRLQYDRYVFARRIMENNYFALLF